MAGAGFWQQLGPASAAPLHMQIADLTGPPVQQPHTNGDDNIPRDEFKRALKTAGNDLRKFKVPETQQ